MGTVAARWALKALWIIPLLMAGTILGAAIRGWLDIAPTWFPA